MDHLLRVCAVGTAFLVVGAASAEAQPIGILSAVYGALGTGRVCNATAAVADLCAGRAVCSVPIGNGLCGDSDFLTIKAAQITYACGRSQRALVGQEYTTATLSCE